MLRLSWETFVFLVKLPMRLFWVAQEWSGVHYAADVYEEYLEAHGNPLPDEKHLKKALASRSWGNAHFAHPERKTRPESLARPGGGRAREGDFADPSRPRS